MRILVVDDSADSRALLTAALYEAGLTDITAVEGARKAFSYLGIDPPGPAAQVDLIFMDLGMPDIDGLAAIQRIPRVERLPGVPITVVTAHSEEPFLEGAFAEGAVDYITKPFRLRELVARTRAALRGKHERDRRSTREQALQRTAQRLEKLSRRLENETQQDPLTGI